MTTVTSQQLVLALSSGGSTTNKLREVDMNFLSNSACKNDYNYPSSWMLCANVNGGGKDACQGDSGKSDKP